MEEDDLEDVVSELESEPEYGEEEDVKLTKPSKMPFTRRSIGGKARQGGKVKKPKKREIKDSEFGFGGRKGSKKQNVAETTNDLRGFNRDSLSRNKKRKR
ncbi:hypothetical protein L3X38_012614 [Prunus dulcis]|uniref:Uncharacterized protein n=1 Tax=Prunus dulcis TaxID=3755 RepID=A0AAD4ZFE1_PRUDU|nr:hypothetical protein L3X38_012614 [Prunus dulcis]